VREVAIEKAKKLAESAQNGVTLETLGTENQAEIKTIEGLKRNESSADFGPEAVAALFSIPQGGFTFAPESDGKGARVMQLQSVGLQPADKTPGETAKIVEAVAAGSGNEFLAQYVAELETDLGVSVNQELWSKVTGANAQ
jgi:peptidyl-prolyl cis-trans isomerase D